MGRAALLGAALLVSATACGGEDAARSPVPDSAYVEAMARMVLLDTAVSPSLDPPLSGPALDSARQRVLERYGVDTEQLLEFARTEGDDPGRMQAVWQRVRQLSDSLRKDRWRPEVPEARDTVAGNDTVPGNDSAGGPQASDPAGDGPGREGGDRR